ncbi:alpha/beta fold hydrolase [Actinokineospora iranica]|uniref:Pimeloyl-ACP methyl ester carboxylesterase n=1 Tax=Actinokineospora iranica TaxID=1271860 RepID=A0A1G6RDB1_9PSEU|nr:alpha/beta fold hydrolase [Actinokineospora iranica]SDD02528.1 Pimeloyl-ACP methyl ester carboxylesterase [Actinokineospora iranica]
MTIEVAYDRRGQGSPLVLLHGIGHRWQAWEPVLDRLAERHDVIAVDLPGFGASPALPPDRTHDVDGMIGALGEVFADLGIGRPHLAGNSLGGMLALEMASRGLAASATAFSPAGFWTPRGRAWGIRVLRAVRLTARAPLREALVQRKLVRVLGGSVLFGKPGVISAEVMLADMAAMVAAPGFDAVIAAGGADYVFACPPPAVPVTVAWGSRDRVLWPRQARRAAELLPAARHVSLRGCGHVPMSDDPGRVADLILETCRDARLV